MNTTTTENITEQSCKNSEAQNEFNSSPGSPAIISKNKKPECSEKNKIGNFKFYLCQERCEFVLFDPLC